MSDTNADLTPAVGTLPPEIAAKARALADSIHVEDSASIIQYGIGAQKDISTFADTMLKNVTSKDAGAVGESLRDLMFRIKDVGVADLPTGKVGFFDKLFGGIERFFAKYQKIETQIDSIVGELEKHRMNLMRDISLLDQLFQKNGEYLSDLDVFLAAGQLKLQDLRDKDLPALQTKAQASQDPVDAQKYNDFQSFVNRFDKKLYDLKLTRQVALQTGPQVRLIQGNDQALVEKIQSSLLTTIPLWKNQIVIAIALFRQKAAVKAETAVTDATNELLLKNSELLKQGSVEVAQATERGIIEVETLKTTNANLIATLEETIKIHEDGAAKRREAEGELSQIEADLKAKLINLQGS
jgi:uncharacterized protein YaaN involved in tellurite resistance